MTHKGREVEIKLAVSGAAEARRMLRAGGFRVSKRRVLEKNTVFDTSSQTLRKSARLLRVREIGKTAKLTYKGPPDNGKHKSREELELDLSDARTIGSIFDRLAYHPAFRYEKFRTTYGLPGMKILKVELDETPIGTFVELEGPVPMIDRRRLVDLPNCFFDVFGDGYGGHCPRMVGGRAAGTRTMSACV